MPGTPGPRVVLDVCGTQTSPQGERGIPRYITDHVRALRAAGAPLSLIGLDPEHPLPARFPPDLLTDPGLGWLTSRSTRAATEHAAGVVFHSMSPFEMSPPRRPLIPRFLSGHAGVASTVYDIIPWVFPDQYLGDVRNRRAYETRLEAMLASDLLLTISAATARDLVEFCDVDPSRCRVIGTGVSDFFGPAPSGHDPAARVRRALTQVRGDFVLCVAGYEWRKNVPRLISAWAEVPAPLRRDLQLVVACSLPDAGRREWLDHIAAAGLSADDVVLSGIVSDEVLRDLYRATSLFVFPSLYEGFGLPVAEAARCGAPVITSSTSSLPEIIELPESTFDPYDIGAIAAAIERGLTDDELRGRLLAAGNASVPRHDWRRVAAATISAYDELAARSVATQRMSVRERPRLGLVGPFSPAPSGVAEYNSRLVAALAPLADLTCFAEVPDGVGRPSLDGVDQMPIEALGTITHPTDFDAIVYTIGNSVFHHKTAALAEQFGGLIWLHDVTLSGLYLSEARTHAHPEEVMRDRLLDAYGDRVPRRLRGEEILDPPAYADGGVRLSSILARRARRVVVSSHLAAHLLSIDLGPLDVDHQISVVPLAVPQREYSPEATTDVVTVTSFGIVDHGKGIDPLMEAVARLRSRLDVRLRLVGECPEPLAPYLDERCRRLGLEDALTVTGWVGSEEYEDELRRASIVVQLRSSSNGESSAAVLDALSAGRAVVTSVAAAAELPSGTVDHLPMWATTDDVERSLVALAESREARSAMVAAQRTYAPQWGFDDVARALLDLATG
jgi:glycosyltransferase involved in cell wall biosynthesis